MAKAYWELDRGHTIEGLWWLPTSPENEVPGRLVYQPGAKLELLLLGKFEAHRNPFELFWPESEEKTFKVFGRTLTGVPMTVSDCYVLSFPDENERIHVNSVLIGVHQQAADSPLVKLIVLDVSNLETWAQGFELKIAPPRSGLANHWEISADPANTVELGAGPLPSLPGSVKSALSNGVSTRSVRFVPELQK